uniref:Basigin n=1 Tax=Schistocephalus solidus TaxID=70667 RepID=A0A0X3PCB3_SCHSO
MLASIVTFLLYSAAVARGQSTCLKNAEVNLITRTEKIGQVHFEKKVVDSKTPINMTFVIPGSREIKKIKWRFNDGPIDVDNDGRPPVHYLLEENASKITVTLVLEAPRQHFIGEWLMELKDTGGNIINQTCQLTSPPLVHRFEETFRATEGYELKAVCRSASMPLPSSARWFKLDDSLNLQPVNSAPDSYEIPGDTLLFAEVHKSDTGIYFCNVTGIGGTDSAPAYIKVKSRLAALWPFIGILAELIILLLTIIIYERHKATKDKKAAEDFPLLGSQVNAGGDAKASPSHR